VQHAAVVAGLVAARAVFFLENENLDLRITEQNLMRCCQANDSATDDGDFHRHTPEDPGWDPDGTCNLVIQRKK
jgi:hypothetical protein